MSLIEKNRYSSEIGCYYRGDLSLLELPVLSIIGSRKASRNALEIVRQYVPPLIAEGVVIMSGLAYGVDETAHRACIVGGGRTVAVIGTPLEQCYPRENAILQKDIEKNHLLLSPFASGTVVQPKNFPQRNRVMARCSNGTFLVEADEHSGTIHQVKECFLQSKPVFALRSFVESASCPIWISTGLERLILIDSVGDILDVLLKLSTSRTRIGAKSKAMPES